MNSSYTNVLNVAKDALSHQDFPISCLYMVATPIGNLADITLRALNTLFICDFLACEDTRESKHLLTNYGIDKPASSWIAVHQHNEAEQCPKIISLLSAGHRVAVLCDAGTPGVSDPGAWLARSVSNAGFRVIPIPGASSVTTLLSASGIVGHGGFDFVGFLPTKASERSNLLKLIDSQPKATVLLEAPHRLDTLASSISFMANRKVTIGRELTKQFEEIVTLEASQISDWLNADSNRKRGEFVIVIHPSQAKHTHDTSSHELLIKTLLEELSLKTTVKLAQQLTGAPKNELYALALKFSKQENS